MIIYALIAWMANCIYSWSYGIYDFPYYLISGLIFFVPCVDLIDSSEKFFQKDVIKKMWALSGLGLISGLALSFGIALTSVRFFDEENLHEYMSTIYISWALGLVSLIYFSMNFFLSSKKIIAKGSTLNSRRPESRPNA